MPDVKYSISVDAQGAVKSVETLDQAFKKLAGEQATLGATTEVTSSKFGGLWKQFALGQVVMDVARQGFRFLKQTLIDSIKEAADYEKAVKGLNSAFMLSGRTMPGMVEHLRRYGTELQNLGLEEDDVVVKSEALLLQLTNLDEKGIKAATRGAIGLSSVFGMDLFSATEMVAKGMEGNYLMLNRLIPAVRNATTEEGKRAAMMKTFEALYARAIADTETYAGQVKKLGLEWKEAKQALGDSIISTGILQGAMEGLTVVVKGLAGQTAREQKAATLDQIEANNKAGESLRKMSEALGWNKRDTALLREQYHLSSVQLVEWIKQNLFGTAASKALASVLKGEAAALAETNKGYSETGPVVAKATEKITLLNTAIDAMPWGKHRAELLAAETWLRSTAVLIEGQLPAVAGYSSALDNAARHVALVRAELERLGLLPHTIEKLKASFEQIAAAAQQVFSSFGAVFDQAQRNREIGIENEYKKRLAYINANVKDEAARQKAIIALEAEYQVKRSSAAAAGAKQAKAVAMMEATVNTAAAVAKVYAQFGWPLGVIFGALIGALGAVQIGLIQKQPIPLAKGAMFSKPTLLPAVTYQVGDAGPGNPEIIAPKSTIRDAVREAMGQLMPQMAFAGGGGTVNLYLTGPLIEAHGWSDNELRVGADKLVGYVNEGLRRLGRKQL